MATTIDRLQIEINTQATKANTAIDNLIGRLDKLTTSLGRINSSSINGLANGVDRLGKAMQTMNGVKTSDFTRLAKNISKMGSVNTQALNSTASSLSHITRAFNNLGSVSANSVQMAELAKSLSKLGGVNVQRAITNIPQLATALNNLMVTLSRSPRVSDNVIRLTNSLARLASQGGKVGTSSRSLQNSLNSTNIAVKKARVGFTGLASTIGRLYATYFWVKRIFDALKSSITSTADYIEAYNYFNVALGKIGSDWSHQWEKYASEIGVSSAEEYADSFSSRLQENLKGLSGVSIELDAKGNGLLSTTGTKNLGLNIQEVTQYASQLASVTNSVGQTGEVSLATASAFTKLGADMSSLFNLDYSSVMNNLQSGLIGQSRALYKYGIDITNATLQTYAYELGLEKAVSEMTQAEKMQLRMIAILDQSKVSWGDLANTINSPSNMIRQFKNNLKETGMVLGQLFIPLLQKVLPVINGVTIALKNLFVNLAGFLNINIDLSSFGQGYSDIGEEMDGVADSFDNATESAKEWKNQLMGFDEINKLQEDNSSKNGVGGSIDLTDEILKATSEYEKVWQQAYDRMENDAEKWAQRISKKLQPIKKLFQDIAIGDWFAVGQDVSNLTAGIFHFFSDAIDNVNWKQVGEKIGNYLEGINWYKVITEGIKLKFEIGKAIAEVWFSSLNVAPIETSIITALATLKFTGLGKILGNKIKKVIMGSAFTTSIVSGFKGAFASLGGSIGSILAMDLAVVFGAGSIAEIGMTIGVGLASSVLAGIAGWGLGQKIYELISGEHIEESFTEQMSIIAEGFKDGSIKDALRLWGEDIIDGLKVAKDSVYEWWQETPISEWLDVKVGSIFHKNNLQDIKNASQEMFSRWFGKNPLSATLSDIFVLTSTAIAKPSEIIDGLRVLWQDVCAGDFRFSLFNIMEFPSYNEFEGALKLLWKDVKNGDFRFEIFNIMQFPSWNETRSALRQMWTDILNGDFKFNFLGLFTFPSWNELKSVITQMWNNILNSGFKFGFLELFEFPSANDLINSFKKPWNEFANWLNKQLTWEAKIKNPFTGKTLQEFKFDFGNVPKFATGGFPEDGLFMANHNELVGQFSNGNTVVANNEQIIAGIQSGVYEAVLSAMNNANQGTQGDIVVQIDGKKVFQAVRKQHNNYLMQTGKNAFA